MQWIEAKPAQQFGNAICKFKSPSFISLEIDSLYDL